MVPRALEETVRQWVQNGRRIDQQLQALHQRQLEQWLQHKHQLTARRVHRPTQRPDHSR